MTIIRIALEDLLQRWWVYGTTLINPGEFIVSTILTLPGTLKIFLY